MFGVAGKCSHYDTALDCSQGDHSSDIWDQEKISVECCKNWDKKQVGVGYNVAGIVDEIVGSSRNDFQYLGVADDVVHDSCSSDSCCHPLLK